MRERTPNRTNELVDRNPPLAELTAEEAEGLLRLMAVGLGDAGPGPPHSSSAGVAPDRAEARYRTLVEQIPAITFMAALDGGVNELYVSPQIEQILGFTQQEWLEDPVLWYSRLHPDDRGRWHTEFARTCATGTRFQSEYRFSARDGRIVWVHGEAQIVRDDAGRPLFLQGIAFDITVQKQAEETLRRSQRELEELVEQRTTELTNAIAAVRERETRLRSVVETAADGIIVIDERGTIEAFNRAAEKIFGYAAEEIRGANVATLMPAPYRDEHDGYLARYRTTGIAKIIGIGREVVGRRKDGATFPMDLAVSAMVVDGQHKFTGIVRDVAEKKRTEEGLARAREEKVMAEAANRAKNEFLSRMSHELRTPLNAILGFNQLLGMGALTDDQRECVHQVSRGGKHLLNLINEVLDIARIETGQTELSPEPIHVGNAFREALALVQPLAGPARIRFAVDLDRADRFHVLADAQRLKQVLINLLSNAVKYNKPEGEVRLECEAAGQRRLRLIVHDTGRGIAPEMMGRLFVPFDRLGAELSGIDGTGLGLPLSKSLVEIMGGTLTAVSAPGEGSRFCVELPRAEPRANGGPPGSGERSNSPASAIHLRNVLYIEDNPDNFRLVQSILHHRPGVHVIPAENGSLGLELARKRRPDLILLDVHLPDCTGDWVLRRLQDDDDTRAIPVVVLSADATGRQIERLRAAGARDYLTKPIDILHFLKMVDEILKLM